LKALGIGPGDEVITAPNSFIASAWVIEATGATPVYCDVDEGFNIDPRKLNKKINRKTKAILPVHLAGVPCKIEEILTEASTHEIPILEDCAQAIGATFKNVHVGNFGLAGGFSLHPLKNLGVLGDGGFITTNDQQLAEKLQLLRNHGLVDRDNVLVWGYNSRLDEIQSGIGRIKLKYLNEWNSRTTFIANQYSSLKSEMITTLRVPSGAVPAWHNFLVFTKKRDLLKDFLFQQGIDTRIHYPIPIHLQKVYSSKFPVGSFPQSEFQAKYSLSLPIYPSLTNEQVEYVMLNVRKFFGDY
jgi:dTDP-4-amino-4,6-dideoxygalactose transaminase